MFYGICTMKEISYAQYLKYYWEYHEKIYRYLYFRSYEDRELAEDLTSETFLKAFEKLDTFNPEHSFSSWIYAIARNSLIDHFRKHSNTSVSLEPYEEELESDFEVEIQINNKLTRRELLKGVYQLPKNLQEVVILKYFNDYKNSEIQEMLDINPSTLRVHLHRAMKQLQEIIPPTILVYLLFPFL